MFPHLITAANVPKLVKTGEVDWDSIDAAFCCLPHATTQACDLGHDPSGQENLGVRMTAQRHCRL